MLNPINVTSSGDWKNTINWLEKLKFFDNNLDSILNQCGQEGVDALMKHTPVETGLAKSSWGYEIIKNQNGATIEWHNYDIEGGYNVILLIQYGHGTRGGTYVSGNDILTPAIQPVIDNFKEEIFKEVMSQ